MQRLGFSCHTDHRYSVEKLTNQNAAIVVEYDYDAYGKQTLISGTFPAGQSYGHTGRRHDEETGLQYFRARYYSAEQGRFISRDPLGYVDGPSGCIRAYFVSGGMDWSGLEFVDQGISWVQYGYVYGETYASFKFDVSCAKCCDDVGGYKIEIVEFKIEASAKVAILANDPNVSGNAFVRSEKNIRRTEMHEQEHIDHLSEIHDEIKALLDDKVSNPVAMKVLWDVLSRPVM